ncbi:HEPN family nuclease [Desulfosediminicola ganghwensis]|uniref:HEPN family nuclease n=1 Tax=Desulfosediminicola ganghwensis TaxID=2569540 RepID=UPI0010AD324C|nr:HEPN family nuclease [Desulfosediminicola ganghwensis]
MGNYANFEPDFIHRTVALIEQYYQFIESDNIEFGRQYNYTLVINCFLGLVVMPKERIVDNIPNDQLSLEFRSQLGLENTEIHETINTLRHLIHQLRNSVAHFNIEVLSADANFRVDYLKFKHRNGNTVAKIPANEMVTFLKAYSEILLNNIHN